MTLTFAASDNAGGSGVAKTEYSTDGGATWTSGASATFSAQGATAVQYRSADVAGNLEAAKSVTVKVDSAKPATKAFKASVKKGKKVKLAYQVTDALPGCGQATATLKIYKGSQAQEDDQAHGRGRLQREAHLLLEAAPWPRAATRSRSTPPTSPATRRARSGARGWW